MSAAPQGVVSEPAVHVRDNGDGTMRARVMFQPDDAGVDFQTGNYLSAARSLLAARWPGAEFRKAGWSANEREAIYHFAAVRSGGAA